MVGGPLDPVREQAVDAAVRVLLKGGASALDLAAVAREGGMTKSTPILARMGVDGIVDAVVGRVASSWEAAVDRALMGADLTADAWVEPVLGALFDAAIANRDLTDALPAASGAVVDAVARRLGRVLDGLGSRRSAFLLSGLQGAMDREIHASHPDRDAFVADVAPLVRACLEGGR